MIRSLFKKQHQFNFFRAVAVMTAFGGLLSAGCIGDEELSGALSGGDEGTDIDAFGKTPFSIKAYVQIGEGDFELVDFPPWDSPEAEVARTALKEGQRLNSTGDDRSRSDIAKKGQAYVLDIQGTPTPFSDLAFWMAADCQEEIGSWFSPSPFRDWGPASLHLWTGGGMSDPQFPQTCDDLLQQQQTMLCTAAKLAEVSESLAPLTFDLNWNGDAVTVVVPPQEEEDRFIARDEALSILAVLAQIIDSAPGDLDDSGTGPAVFTPWNSVTSCAQAYSDVYDDPQTVFLPQYSTANAPGPGGTLIAANASAPELGFEYDSDGSASDTRIRELLRPRMRLLAHTARASLRLMKELAEANVRSDVAGAESIHSLSDAWAMDPEKNLRGYNTYRHALRTVLGGWHTLSTGGEVESPFNLADTCSNAHNVRYTTDPQQDGGLDIADKIRSLRLEVGLRKPITAGQSLAWNLFRSAGLIVRAPQNADPEDLATLLADVLVAQASQRSEVASTEEFSDFQTSPGAEAIRSQVQDLSQEDLVFAANRAWVAYSILVDAGVKVDGSYPFLPYFTFEEAWLSALNSDLLANVAWLVEGGLPESDLFQSTHSRLGRADQQCQESVKDLAQRFRLPLRKLGATDDLAELSLPAALEADQLLASRSGVIPLDAELSSGVFYVFFRLLGDFADFAEMYSKMVFIQGSAPQAECLAGLRSHCDTVDLDDLQISGSSLSSTLSGEDLVYFFQLGLDVQNPNEFWGIIPPSGDTPGSIVMSGRTQGMTLLSEWERDLLKSIEVGRVNKGPECDYSYDPASFEYCIDGVERDSFVPVANSLTGEGQDVDESWKHYLALAKEASTRADELGQQIIRLGTELELRQEGAQEELSALCGGFPTSEEFLAEDSGATACVDEPTVDVVYFTDLPGGPNVSSTNLQAAVVDNLRSSICSDVGTCTATTEEELASLSLCERLDCEPEVVKVAFSGASGALPKSPNKQMKPVITVASLGFKTVDESEEENATSGWTRDYCPYVSAEINSWDKLLGGPNYDQRWYEQLVNSGRMSLTDFQVAANRLKLHVDITGDDWVLLRAGQPLLGWVEWPGVDEDPTALGGPAPGVFGAYPGCLHQTGMECASSPQGCCSATAKGLYEALEGNELASKATLRKWVESALWRVAKTAGIAPKGMFQVPVPASLLATDGSGQAAPAFSAAAYYGSGVPAGSVIIPLMDGTEIDSLGNSTAYAALGGRWTFVSEPWVNQAAGTNFAATRTDNVTFGPWLSQGGQDQFRWLTAAANSALDFRSTFVLSGFAGDLRGLFLHDDYYEEYYGQSACFRGSDHLLNGNFLGATFNLSASECFGEDSFESGRELGGILAYATPWADGPRLVSGRPYDSCRSDFWTAERGSLADPSCYLQNDQSFFPRADDETEDCEQACEEFAENQGGNTPIICGCGQADCNVQVSYQQATIQECTPEDRVFLALYRELEDERTVPLATWLTCLATSASSGVIKVEAPPVVSSADDVNLLRTWLEGVSANLASDTKSLIAVDVPAEVVKYHQKGYVPQGLVGTGTRGEQVLKVAGSMESINSGLRGIRAGVDQLISALGAAQTQFEAVEIAGDKELLQLALSRVDASRQVTQGMISIVSGMNLLANGWAAFTSGGVTAIQGATSLASGLADQQAGTAKLAILEDIEQLAALEEANGNAKVIQGLNDGLLQGLRQIEEGISQVSQARLDAYSGLNAVASRENEGKRLAAVLGGEDGLDLDGDGEFDVLLPANTVYRRQNDVLRLRYERALHTAKRYAYYARLAIEQRLGVRLGQLEEPIGPLEPPARWVDNLCSLTGIDYEALRTACTSEEGCNLGDVPGLSEEEFLGEFANQYVGDYVAQLEEFVENYNIRYPFQDSEDIAVVSVVEHVLGIGACSGQPANLLVSSGDLTKSPGEGELGWIKTGAAEDLGLTLVNVPAPPAEALVEDSSLQLGGTLAPPVAPGGVTELRTEALAETVEIVPEMPNTVFQRIELKAGKSYEVSWWDVARGTGAVSPSSIDYRLVVADENWSPYALEVYSSHLGATSSEWSERRITQFSVATSGTYSVGFQTLEEGVFAIANVQLVDLADVIQTGTPYIDTDVQGVSLCDLSSDSGLSSHFERECDDTGCFYELRESIALREEDILSAAYAGAGIPAANYNYRHVGVALNAVGTGVVDCDGQDSSCFANGFLEYDLEHSAFQSRITNYGGEQQCFSFGTGAIRHGKMLTAERVMGIPMSSTDKEMISGEEFMKPVLRGRPLDGVYRLRIHEREGLNLDELEDVQLVLKHVYWSRVERTPN